MHKIIYIDDTAYWRETYREAFAKAGVDIKTLPDARGDIIKEVLGFHPDLILLDICMPEVTGFDAIGILKKNEKTKNIPVFFFSSISDVATIRKGIALGTVDYLVKPDYTPKQAINIFIKYLKNPEKYKPIYLNNIRT